MEEQNLNPEAEEVVFTIEEIKEEHESFVDEFEEGCEYPFDIEYDEFLYDRSQIKLENTNRTAAEDSELENTHELQSDSDYPSETDEEEEDDVKSSEIYKPPVRKHQKKEIVSTNKATPLKRPINSCIYCGLTIRRFQYQAEHYANEHKELDDGKIVFVCPSCGEEFHTEETWQQHCTEAHQLNELSGLSMETMMDKDSANAVDKVKCLECGYTFRKRFICLLIHASTHMPHKMYKCKYCSEQFRNKWMIRTHFCVQFEEILKLKLPQIDYEGLAKLQRERELQNLLHVCPVCGEEFSLKESWKEHLTTEHQIENIKKVNIIYVPESDNQAAYSKCTICNYTWKGRPSAVKFHVLSHMPFETKKCKICQQASNRLCLCLNPQKQKYKFNLAPVEDCILLCTKCDGSSENFDEMNNHYSTAHNISTPEDLSFRLIGRKDRKRFLIYECTKCQQSTFQTSSYTTMFMHNIKHENVDWLKCKHCNETYRNIVNLKNHVFSCQSGTGSLRVFHYYKRHVKGSCPACGKHFTSLAKLKKHLIYDHGFSNINNLNIVEIKLFKKTHYKCNLCQQLFTSYLLKELQNHAFMHMPFKLYNCNLCNVGCDTQADIVNHLKQSHNIGESNPFQKRTLLGDEYVLYRCPVCSISQKSSIAFIQHLKDAHQFNTLKGLALKISKKPNESNEKKCYECLDCGKSMAYTSRTINRFFHRFSHLPNKPFICGLCKRSFFKSQGIMRHINKCKKKHEQRKKKRLIRLNQLRAQKLKTVVSSSSATSLQKTDKIDEDPLSVQSITLAEIGKVRTFSSDGAIMMEFGEHITYACPECNVPLATQVDYQTHITLNHNFFDNDELHIIRLPDGKFQCSDCGVTVDSAISQQQRHKLTHLPHKSYVCTLCGHRSNTAFVLVGHIRRRHFTTGEFQCPICGLSLETSYKCVIHCRTNHTEAEYPPYLCKICMVNYKTSKGLQQHNKIHDINRKLYNCPKCQNRSYKDEREFKKHLRSAHPELNECIPVTENMDCLICQQRFEDRSKLEDHISKQHNDAQDAANDLGRLVCKLCHKSFKRFTYLTYHMESAHAQMRDKPFPCDMCERRFLRKCHLDLHWDRYHPYMTITTTKKEQKDQQKLSRIDPKTENHCFICQQEFNDRSKLEEHIETQHGDDQSAVEDFKKTQSQRFPCDQCDQRFGKKWNLNHHWKECHFGMKITMMKKEQEDKLNKYNKKSKSIKKQMQNYVAETSSNEDTTESVTEELVKTRSGRPRKKVNYNESRMQDEEVNGYQVSVGIKRKIEKPLKTFIEHSSDANVDMIMECKPDISTILTVVQTEFPVDFKCTDIKEENISDCNDE